MSLKGMFEREVDVVLPVVINLIRSLLNTSSNGDQYPKLFFSLRGKKIMKPFENFALVFSQFSPCTFLSFLRHPEEHHDSHTDDSADAC